MSLNEEERRVMDRRENLTNKHADENDWMEEKSVCDGEAQSVYEEARLILKESARFILFSNDGGWSWWDKVRPLWRAVVFGARKCCRLGRLKEICCCQDEEDER